MKKFSGEIRMVITEASNTLLSFKPGEVLLKEGPDEWSKKEILGHLIDSTANNHQRIVRAACDPAVITFHVYNQTGWVQAQHYNELDWNSLIALWLAYNHHLCDVIERISVEALSARCDIGKNEPVSLEFIIRDYLRHVKHHLNDLLKNSH